MSALSTVRAIIAAHTSALAASYKSERVSAAAIEATWMPETAFECTTILGKIGFLLLKICLCFLGLPFSKIFDFEQSLCLGFLHLHSL